MFKVNIKFILLTAAFYVFAFIQGGNLPYSIFYAFLITFFISLIYIILKERSISVKIKFSDDIYKASEECTFTTIVKNEGILPAPYVVVKNKTLAKLNSKYNGDALWLNSDGNKYIGTKVRFYQRGMYNLGEIVLSISDLFSVFQRNRNINVNAIVKVYPKVYELKEIVHNGSHIFKNTANDKTSLEDIYNVREIRKYNQGDNLKRVNWKVSAKHGELYVKDLETVSGEESNIFLDMSKFNILMDEHGEGEEQLIDLCLSIVNCMNMRNIKTNLFINAALPRTFEIESREDFDELMEFFVTQKSDGENSFEKFINFNLNKIQKSSWIGIVTSGIRRELRDRLIVLRDKGYNITVFYYGEGLKDLSSIQILKSIGIDCLSFNETINSKSKVKL